MLGPLIIALTNTSVSNDPQPLFALTRKYGLENFTTGTFYTLQYILGIYSQMDNVRLFLITALVLAVIAIIAHIFHGNAKVTIAFFAMIVIFTAVSTIYSWPKQAKIPEIKSLTESTFVVLNGSENLGPFNVALKDVDTLKTNSLGDGTSPWAWNLKFGEDSLNAFLNKGKDRLRNNFVVQDNTSLDVWPKYGEIKRIADSPEAYQEWSNLLDRLSGEVRRKPDASKEFENIKLKTAFSKWPLARLSLRLRDAEEPFIDRYFTETETTSLTDQKGNQYTLLVEVIFNGDRDLGEHEACTLKLVPIKVSSE